MISHDEAIQIKHIGSDAQGKSLLKPGTDACYLAAKFIQFYRPFNANGVPMRHGLRRHHEQFAKTPHLLLVDDDRLSKLICFPDPSAS